MYRHGRKTLDTLDFSSGNRTWIDLPRDRFIKRINLALTGTVTLSGGTTSGTVTEDATPQLLSLIEVWGDGTIPLFRSDGVGLYYKNYFETGQAPSIANPADGSAAANAVYATFDIWFENNIGLVPADSFLNASNYRTLRLYITWNTLASMFSGTNDRTKASTALKLTATVFESSQPNPQYLRIQDFMIDTITASKNSYNLGGGSLPVGNRIYQSFMLKTIDTAARANTVLNNINLLGGDKIYHIQNYQWTPGRRQQKNDFSITTLPDGVSYLYLLENGRIPSGFTVADLNTAYLQGDVTYNSGTEIKTYMDYMVKL
jgi:hypothetical protein